MGGVLDWKGVETGRLAGFFLSQRLGASNLSACMKPSVTLTVRKDTSFKIKNCNNWYQFQFFIQPEHEQASPPPLPSLD